MDLKLGVFRFDVSPPMGHSLCGGWIKPVVGYDDALEAIGLVILGLDAPIVICAVDWTGILNSAHVRWREALAKAAQTTPDRVAVQCVHQHNAPFACLDAQQIVAKEGDLPSIVDVAYFDACLEKGSAAVRDCLKRTATLTHIATGQVKVEKVASNRRFVGADGKINAWRGSSAPDAKIRDLPEGMIDPWLKTVAFYSGAKKIAACHYYATHPMSYYGDGRVSSDFVGLARKSLQMEDPDCAHLYFTGCAGNIAAGKYNDGSKGNRPVLAQRMLDAMRASEAALKPAAIEKSVWRTHDILPPPRAEFKQEELAALINMRGAAIVNRNRPAFTLAWLRRLEKKIPITLSALHVNDVALLHLPSESFLEYQLRAQQHAANRFVATAAYGDGGPWYIPVKEAYPQGGYEVTVAFCDPGVDDVLTKGIQHVMGGGAA